MGQRKIQSLSRFLSQGIQKSSSLQSILSTPKQNQSWAILITSIIIVFGIYRRRYVLIIQYRSPSLIWNTTSSFSRYSGSGSLSRILRSLSIRMNLRLVISPSTSLTLKLGYIIVSITNIIYLSLLSIEISYYSIAFSRESTLGTIFSLPR